MTRYKQCCTLRDVSTDGDDAVYGIYTTLMLHITEHYMQCCEVCIWKESRSLLVGAARGAALSASRYSVCTAMTSTLPGQEA